MKARLVLMVWLTMQAAGVVRAEIVFTDVTTQSGMGLSDRLTQAVAWADYDDDGDMDVYLPQRGFNQLFRNDGSGVFTDVTDAAGVAGPSTTDGDSIGVSFGDLDNDGDLDLIVSQVNDGNDQLYRNNGYNAAVGNVTFTEMAVLSGINLVRSARGLTVLDYDRDGLLDLYLMGSAGTLMYRNLGNLRFAEVAERIGLRPLRADIRDVGMVATDIDGNGWPDLFVGNRSDHPTNLFINTDGVFTDQAEAAGITARGLGMGVMSFDYDNDLDFDLYWTTWPGETEPLVSNRFYRNDGNLNFTDVTDVTDTADTTGWGISVNISDVENDGLLDMFVTNGASPTSSPSVFYHNIGNGQFEQITSQLNNMPLDTRSVAFADYDDDGDEDLFITAVGGESNRLYRNDNTDNNRWIKLRLKAATANGFGARVEVTTDLQTTVRELRAATARSNQNPPELIFGLGQATRVEGIKVNWPSGQTQLVDSAALDQTLIIREPGAHFYQYSGSWYGGPSQSGHGFSLEELDNQRMLAYWYTFDNSGQRHWIVMDGRRALNRITGTAFTAQGGLFPPRFNIEDVETTEWGTMEFVFDDCDNGTVSWNPSVAGFNAGSMPLVRLANLNAIECQ